MGDLLPAAAALAVFALVRAPLGGGSHLETIERPDSSEVFAIVPMPRQLAAQPSEVHELTEVRSLGGHTDFVNDIAYSPDGKFVVSAGEEGTVRVWDVETGVEIIDAPTNRDPLICQGWPGSSAIQITYVRALY